MHYINQCINKKTCQISLSSTPIPAKSMKKKKQRKISRFECKIELKKFNAAEQLSPCATTTEPAI